MKKMHKQRLQPDIAYAPNSGFYCHTTMTQAADDAEILLSAQRDALAQWSQELSDWAHELGSEADQQSGLQGTLRSQLLQAKQTALQAASKKDAVAQLEKDAFVRFLYFSFVRCLGCLCMYLLRAIRLESLQCSLEQREQQLLHAENSGEFARQTVALRQHINVTKALKEELEYKVTFFLFKMLGAFLLITDSG